MSITVSTENAEEFFENINLSFNSLFKSIETLYNDIYDEIDYKDGTINKNDKFNYFNESDINDTSIFIKNKLLEKLDKLVSVYDKIKETGYVNESNTMKETLNEIKNKLYKIEYEKERKGWNKYEDKEIRTINYFH